MSETITWEEERWLELSLRQVDELIQERPKNSGLQHLRNQMEEVALGESPYQLEMDKPMIWLYAAATARAIPHDWVEQGPTGLMSYLASVVDTRDVEQGGVTPPTPPPTRVEQDSTQTVEQFTPLDSTPHPTPPGLVAHVPQREVGNSRVTSEDVEQVEQGGVTPHSTRVEQDPTQTVEQLAPPDSTLMCPTCNKEFSRKYNLKRHMETHTKQSSYSCSNCGKTFTRNDSKKRHESRCKESAN